MEQEKDVAAELPNNEKIHIWIPLFGAFNIFLMAFIAVFMA
jgi:hypothetical protein